MPQEVTRRVFVKDSMLTGAGTVAAAGLASQAMAADASAATENEALGNTPTAMPGSWTAKIGDIELSRLMLGGNLIAGYAHSRDLRYVAPLMQRYNTPEKILETLEVAEKNGINSINTCVWDDVRPLRKYWEKHGQKIKWIVAANPSPMSDKPFEQIDKAAKDGAHIIYMQGVCADALVKQKKFDMIKRAAEHMRGTGRPIGICAHSLDVIIACEKAKIDVDFYQKTLHTRNYPTAQKPGETGDYGKFDNSWCRNADEVIDFMKTVKKPWIAFKVMAAGAIPPRKAFPYTIDAGADFVLAGMFDWQIAEDAQIIKKSLAKAKRTRPWRA